MKKILTLICTLLCANVLLAQTRFFVGDLQYEITSTNPPEVMVYSHQNNPTTVIIPETVSYEGTTYSVTSIGNSAFYNCSSLTSVTIPNSVTYIGDIAFSYCSSLTSVTIPNSVTSIGFGAFAYCSSLTSVDIPNSVTYIGDFISAFIGCSSLISLSIDMTSIPCWLGIGASLQNLTLGENVTSIEDGAFSDCSSLTSMTIEMNNIPNLNNTGLNTASLQNLTFGENVTSIASGAFSSSSFLQNVTCLATTPPTIADNTVFPYPNIATLTVPCGTLEAYSSPTSFWNVFFMGRISENGYNVVVTANDNAFGSVTVESDCSTGTLTATANDGYVFLSWNDGNTENPRLVSLTSDTSFVANFALIDESSLLEAEAESISFFPNPTKSEITFSQAIEKVEVIDLTGRCVLTFSNAREINIETIPSGAYYLRLTNNDKAVMRKVIKQ